MGSLEAHGINVATSYINAVMIGVVTPEKRSLILYFCEKNAKMGMFGRLFQNRLKRSRSTIQL